MNAYYQKFILKFKKPSGTSRGVLKTKETYFLFLESEGKRGYGECGLFRGLSYDDRNDYEDKLKWVCNNMNLGNKVLLAELIEFPSIQFGLETAIKSMDSSDPFKLFPSRFTHGEDSIPINGLIWMGSKQFMKDQIKEKIKAGFNCIKMKIGAIDFATELDLLKSIRKEYSSKDIELRVDANGAFGIHDVMEKLKKLSELDLHSIEQPIKQGQQYEMAKLCANTPLPIALDEELIGIFSITDKLKLIQTINPLFIILKPSLIGGFKGCDEWIDIAEKHKIKWWVTSALESNVGLNAIAQYTYIKNIKMPQGLGTGSLFTNNFDCPIQVKNGTLHYDNNLSWEFNLKYK